MSSCILAITKKMQAFDKKSFVSKVIGTWPLSMGRYWDGPNVNILQHLGLGSVAYLFC